MGTYDEELTDDQISYLHEQADMQRARWKRHRESAMADWRPIATFDGADHLDHVDLWLHIYASPRSMGMSDSFRVPDAWRVKGRWFHYHNGKPTELFNDYVTHWMPMPEPPPQ